MMLTWSILASLLCLVPLYLSLTASYASDPSGGLCSHLATGSFASLDLSSLTFDATDSQLYLLTGGGARGTLYELNPARLGPTELNLRNVRPVPLDAKFNVPSLHLTASSRLHFFTNQGTSETSLYHSPGGREDRIHRLQLIGGRYKATQSWSTQVEAPFVPAIEDRRPRWNLLHFNKSSNRLFIYQETVRFQSDGHFAIPQLSLSQLDSIHYFTLQLTSNASTVLLSHKNVPEPPKAEPLMSSLPMPYIDAPSGRLYLFDRHLACVYILPAWSDLNLGVLQGRQLLTRINVPFERFFKCDEEGTITNEQWRPDRCETVRREKPTLTTSSNDPQQQKLSLWLLLGVLLLCTVLILLLMATLVIRQLRGHSYPTLWITTPKRGVLLKAKKLVNRRRASRGKPASGKGRSRPLRGGATSTGTATSTTPTRYNSKSSKWSWI